MGLLRQGVGPRPGSGKDSQKHDCRNRSEGKVSHEPALRQNTSVLSKVSAADGYKLRPWPADELFFWGGHRDPDEEGGARLHVGCDPCSRGQRLFKDQIQQNFAAGPLGCVTASEAVQSNFSKGAAEVRGGQLELSGLIARGSDCDGPRPGQGQAVHGGRLGDEFS